MLAPTRNLPQGICMTRRTRPIDETVLLALLGCALGALGIIGFALARTEPLRPAPIVIPPPDFTLQLSTDGRDLTFAGTVDFGLTEALGRMLGAHPGVQRILLESGGGSIAEARGAVRVIREHALATHVDGHCASACALIFVGGIRRSMGSTARVGFHGYSVPMHNSYGMIDPQAEMLRDMAIYRAQAVAEPFIAILSSLPRVPMWYPEPAELRSAGVLTAP